MSLWIIYTLSIFTFLLQCHCFEYPTSRILDVGVPPWKPIPQFHTAVGPHYISIGALNPTNNLHFSQIAQHNAQLMQQVKGFNAPVTQYRNPFPMFQPASPAHHQHHHFILPKDNGQHIHSSASNIAQTILPSNYLKPAFITGKPAFNLKPEYITKPDFYNGIHTNVNKNPQVPGFKQIPSAVKDAMASFFQEPSAYKDLLLGQPHQQFQNHDQFGFKPHQTFKDKPVGSFSFPNDGLGSLTFYGPASHLIRGGKPSPPKPQPTIFIPAEIGSNYRNGQQFAPPNRQLFHNPPQLFHSLQPVRFESSTPSFFGTTSVKISPSQSFELTITKTPDGKEVVSSSTAAPLPQKTESSIHTQNSEQVKSQALPPIPASVLTPFFHQIQQQQSTNQNNLNTVPKDKFVQDEYSEHLVPPPYSHLESSTFRTTPYTPARRPVPFREQANALNILNKYNIPVISPLQDAAKFKYDGSSRKPTIIPLNYTVSSVMAFPTNAPQNTPLSIHPTGVLSGVESFTNANFNSHNFFDNNAYGQSFGKTPTDRNPEIPQRDTFNPDHTFFTVDDALTVQPIAHQTPVAPTTVFSNIPTQLQVQENPEVIIKEEPSTLTTNPPRTLMQLAEYRTTTTTTPLPVLPLSPTTSQPTASGSSGDAYGSRNRLRVKTRRRRPKPNTSNDQTQLSNDDSSAFLHQQDTVHERPATSSSTSTTERNIHRTRPVNRGRPQVRPVEASPSDDPTLRVIQRNSLKTRFNSVVKHVENRQPTDLYSTTAVDYHPPTLKATLPTEEEDVDDPEQDTYFSTTATASENENIISGLQQDNSNAIFNTFEDTTLPDASIDQSPPELTKQFIEPSSAPDVPSVQTPAPSTEQVILNQTPQQFLSEPTKPAEDDEPHLSHRQRFRYKLKTTPETIVEPETLPSEEPKEVVSSSSSTASSDATKGVTRLRPVNKYRSQDRPRFSVKDYRNRVRNQSPTTASTEAPSYSSTTAGYNRSRHRFPTRKRLLPSLRTRASTTEKSSEPDTNDEQIHDSPDEQQLHSNEGPQVATVTSSSSSQSSKSRRVTIRRGSQNRFRTSTSTTELPSASKEDVDRKTPIRQWTRDRYNHRSRIPTSTTENVVQAQQLNLNPEDLNNIAVDTESLPASSTTEARPETAIMKIGKTDHTNKQSGESFDDGQPATTVDLNESPSEQSERVAQLTLSGSSYKFNNLSKNNLSRRIPGYFTLATEDPILPIEAFFPNVKPISNRTR